MVKSNKKNNIRWLVVNQGGKAGLEAPSTIFYLQTWKQYKKNQYQSVTVLTPTSISQYSVLRMKFRIEISQYQLLYVNRLRCALIKIPDTENTCSIFAEYFPVILKY
ncbi:hypothetical protein BpHYR1_045223 [Brachionus plicatilis]|uniref:Uncharacterized protein n=1 Tax=Brachionus plicatilis TaxID=10195 RepID=A0A3M7R404_BRAPC|nr:hypothetical protein BpHYR1_045223 [Brachionus plicatilis]